MLEIKSNQLFFSFPEIHPDAKFSIEFQRTLRIPDDGNQYKLPPGFGPFPIENVKNYNDKIPEKWVEQGGVMIPMYMSEAMWIRFVPCYSYDHRANYPFAIKVASGKRSALTGNVWTNSLREDDYMVSPIQPWLDGFVVENGVIRQFVAVPLGSGATVEEQITGEAKVGGLQIKVIPMKRETFEKKYPKVDRETYRRRDIRLLEGTSEVYSPMWKCAKSSVKGISVNCDTSDSLAMGAMDYSASCNLDEGCAVAGPAAAASAAAASADYEEVCENKRAIEATAKKLVSKVSETIGFGAGGTMKQAVLKDEFGIDSWEEKVEDNRCFVHLANSMMWETITGKKPPTVPMTAALYAKHNYRWYDHYEEKPALSGCEKLKNIKSVAQIDEEKGTQILPENQSIDEKAMKKNNPAAVDDGKW